MSKRVNDTKTLRCANCNALRTGLAYKFKDIEFKLCNACFVLPHLCNIECEYEIKCLVCGNDKPLLEFVKNRVNRNGHSKTCRECAAQLRDKTTLSYKQNNHDHDCELLQCRTKIVNCKFCKQNHELSCFNRSIATKSGHSGNCKFKSYQDNAKNNNRIFELTPIDFWNLLLRPCTFCGYISTNVLNGIDRWDNNEGYIPQNCLPVCWDCNSAKGKKTANQFTAWLARLTTFTIEKVRQTTQKMQEAS